MAFLISGKFEFNIITQADLIHIIQNIFFIIKLEELVLESAKSNKTYFILIVRSFYFQVLGYVKMAVGLHSRIFK